MGSYVNDLDKLWMKRADDVAEETRFGERRWRHFGEIVGKEDETGVLVLFPFAFLPLLELRVGGA